MGAVIPDSSLSDLSHLCDLRCLFPHMIELRALGTLALRDPNGEDLHSILAQPKRVALLAYLAIARPRCFHRRDTLLALLWPGRTTSTPGGRSTRRFDT